MRSCKIAALLMIVTILTSTITEHGAVQFCFLNSRNENITIVGGPTHSTGSTVNMTAALNISYQPKGSYLYHFLLHWKTNDKKACRFSRGVNDVFDFDPILIINKTNTILDIGNSTNSFSCDHGLTAKIWHENERIHWNLTWANVTKGNHTSTIRELNSELECGAVITVKDCEPIMSNGYIQQDYPPENHTYNTKANFSCISSNGSKLYRNNIIVDNVKHFEVACNEQARWQSSAGYECWYAPKIDLQAGTTPCCNYTEEENGTFYCNCIENGYPTNYTYWLHINGRQGDEPQEPAVSCLHSCSYMYTIQMKHTYNNATLECRTNHTFYKNGNTLIASKNVTLNIEYGPKIIDDSSCAYRSSTTLYNITIQLTFLANPRLESNAVLVGGQVPSKNEIGESYNFGVLSFLGKDLHKYQLRLPEVEHGTAFKFFANYSLKGMSRNSTYTVNVSNCEDSIMKTTAVTSYLSMGTATSESSTSSSLSTTTSAAVHIEIIAVSVGVGSLAVFAIFALTCILKRKWKQRSSEHIKNPKQSYEETTLNEASEKEDVINPLYGNTTNTGVKQQASQKLDSEREEKVNPVYQPISGAYSQVDVKNKKKQKEKQNPKSETNKAFTSDNQTAIYAAVNKKDKPLISGQGAQSEETYSEVKKDTKKKGKEDKPSTSGQSSKDTVQSEATYSEVKKDKPKKPKDDDEDEDLHGSSKKT